jgi:hypothetical protein
MNWKELYKTRRKVGKYAEPWHKDESFFGIALAAWATTLEIVFGFIWEKIFTLPHNRIRNGYTMLLLGPLWWVLSGLLFVPAAIVIMPFAIPVGLWTLIFELPAAALVGDFKKPIPQASDRNKTTRRTN